MHKTAKSRNDDGSWALFRTQPNKVNNLVRTSKINYMYFKKLATSLQQGNLNPKQWWTVTKQFLKQNKDSDISLIIQHDNHFTTPQEKSTVLNNHFCMQSTIADSHGTLPPFEPPEHTLGNVRISSQDVEDVLRLLDASKASWPDLIHPRLLKEGAFVMSPHLSKLFNKSIELCQFPSDWKLANIIPVYKKGDRTNATNYRPMSLLSCLGKVLEKMYLQTFIYLSLVNGYYNLSSVWVHIWRFHRFPARWSLWHILSGLRWWQRSKSCILWYK